MLLPNKYKKIENSYIYKLSFIIKELKKREMNFEEIQIMADKKYNYKLKEVKLLVLLGYGMGVLNVRKEGYFYVETK